MSKITAETIAASAVSHQAEVAAAKEAEVDKLIQDFLREEYLDKKRFWGEFTQEELEAKWSNRFHSVLDQLKSRYQLEVKSEELKKYVPGWFGTSLFCKYVPFTRYTIRVPQDIVEAAKLNK